MRVAVEDLVVRYPGRGRPALGGVTFTAEPGTITAVVGGSGGGKSTLLAVILGFVPADSGRVSVSAADRTVDLADIDVLAWRSRVAWLPQRAHAVDVGLSETPTIREAVALRRPDAPEDDVWVALTDAGLADDIRALPQGLATPLAADGSGLSVGQLQRLSLARAILGDADVVLLDEPTAALDPQTEDVVVRTIARLAERGATVVVVAHRPALVAVAHRLVRVEAPAVADPVPAVPAATDAIRRSGW